MRKLAVAILLLSASVTAFSQSTEKSGDTFIYAGHLLDRPGSSPRGESTIVVHAGKIAEVQNGFIAAPAGVTVVDLKDRYVLPGLIDAHVHLATDPSHALNPSVADGAPLSAYEALWNAQKTLMAGFTTVRNVGDFDGATLALREAIARGWVTGPRILDAGRPITSTYGHGDRRVGMSDEVASAFESDSICDGPDECRKAVRRQIGRGVDVIKIITTGLSSKPVGPNLGAQMSKEEITSVIETAHQYGKKVAAHAHGGAGVDWALEAGVDSIEHGTLMSDADIALLKKSGAYYVPTLSTVTTYQDRLASGTLSPEWRAITEERISKTGRSVEKAVRAGVKIVLGTDAGFTKHGQNATEFGLLVQHGLTPMQAIVAGTTNAADLLGISNEVGSIETGKSADVVAVSADPLKDVSVLRSVNFVMRAGVVYKNHP
jgi:imidazolonepropionase-like amidohydrolase